MHGNRGGRRTGVDLGRQIDVGLCSRTMLVEQIRARVLEASKSGDTTARDVLRLALGEIQTAEARKNASLSDDDAGAVLRKLVKSNEETFGSLPEGDDRRPVLKKEIEILLALLPREATAEEVAAWLAPVADAVKAAGNDGQATGVAMKHLKSSGKTAPGNVVSAAVKALRTGA